MSELAEPARRPLHIPTLRKGDLDPETYARSTCFEAGYLVVKNAGWRNIRPVVDRHACTGCLQCYMHCPDGTMYKIAAPDDSVRKAADLVAVDYDFCKGCGICAKICGFGAVAMISEQEALAAEALSGDGRQTGSTNESEADAR